MTSQTLDVAAAPESVGLAGDEEFELDMRVVEATTPLVSMTCDTSDACGSTCGTSACNTSSYDPI